MMREECRQTGLIKTAIYKTAKLIRVEVLRYFLEY